MVGKSAVEDVLEQLRQEIVEHYAVGDVLPNERELAERFGVARNTIRETMIHLEAFRLIEKTRRGAKVRKPGFDCMFEAMALHFDRSARTFAEVLDFRRIIETGAAPSMVVEATDDDIARLEEANAGLRRALTAAEAAAADFAFHLNLLRATHNSVLCRLYEAMATPLKFYLEVGKTRAPATETAMEQHAAIIDALRARDVAELTAALHRHFDHSGKVLASHRDEDTPDAPPAAPVSKTSREEFSA